MKKGRRKIAIGVLICCILFSAGSISGVLPKALELESTVTIAKAATMGEQNALQKAKLYLSTMPFSKKGLKKQLKFEGYTNKEATYGVNHCGANWMKQAVKKAKQYLQTMSFSKSGLKKQLLFEGFTKKQANYGVKKAYR